MNESKMKEDGDEFLSMTHKFGALASVRQLIIQRWLNGSHDRDKTRTDLQDTGLTTEKADAMMENAKA